MSKATSADDIRSLASRLREIADATVIPDYARLMAKAALELEHRALLLEASLEAGSQALGGGLPITLKVVSA